MSPRSLIGLIRALPKGAEVCLNVSLTPDRATAVRVSKALALRMVRRLYGTGARVTVDVFAGDVLIGV